MCLNRILVTDAEVHPVSRAVVLPPDDERTRHVRNVLRVEQGASVRIAVEHQGTCDGTVTSNQSDAGADGTDAEGTTTPQPLALRLGAIQAPRQLPPITLIMAPPRPRALRRAVRAATQVGVRQIVLVGAARVERSFFASKALRPEVLRANAVDGVMQAAVDANVPPVMSQPRLHLLPETLAGIPSSSENAVCILLHPGGAPLEQVLRESMADSVVLAIGPEGGWLENELNFLQRHQFVLAGLGPRILTTEVALTVALTIVHQQLARTNSQQSNNFTAGAALVAT